MNTMLTCFFGAGAYPVYASFAASLTGLGLDAAIKYVVNTDF